MKKTLMMFAIAVSGIFYSQKSEFAKFITNIELLKVKNDLKQEQKRDFYSQYLKNKLVEDMKHDFTYKKYSDIILRKFADTIMSFDSTERYKDNDENLSIKNLEMIIGQKNKVDEINENLSSLLGDFPVIVKANDASEGTAYEVVPGEILKISTWGGGNMVGEEYYKISNNNIESISVIPESESFLKKVSKNVKNVEVAFYGSKGNSYTDIVKDTKNNTYIINASLFKVEDNFAPYYELKYSTKDFKNFKPIKVRYNDDKAKWKIIK